MRNHPLGIIDTLIEPQQELDFFAALLDCQDQDRRNLVLHVQNVLERGDMVAKFAFSEIYFRYIVVQGLDLSRAKPHESQNGSNCSPFTKSYQICKRRSFDG